MDETEMNMTLIEDDVFKDISNETIQDIISWPPSTFFMIIDSIEFLIICLAVIADLFLITTLLRFKRLKTRINTYILHFIILNLIYHIFSPTVLLASGFFSHGFGIIYCVTLEIKMICLSGSFLLATALAADWYLMAFVPEFITKIRKIYNYSFILLYVVILLTLMISLIFINCYDMVLSRILFTFCLFTLSAINILTYIRNISYETSKTLYALAVANISIYSWLGMFLVHLFYEFDFVYKSGFWIYLLSITGFITSTIAYGSPILILYILGKRNKYFKMAFDRTFKKSTRVYEADDLDVASEDQNHIVESRINDSNTNGSIDPPGTILNI